jgi:hypothetical protein
MGTAAPAPDPVWDDLVDRLAVHDIHYLTGGSAWDGHASHYRTSADAEIHALIRDLARAPHARMRNALVALLFRHPEYAGAAREVTHSLDHDDAAHLLIAASVLVAAALRAMWSFVLGIYLSGQAPLPAEDLAAELGVPSPTEDYGRLCMQAVADLPRAGQVFPFNYDSAWNDVAGHVLADLRLTARVRSAR